MARRCGAKRIFRSKCTKRHMLGPSLEVSIPKNGTPLRREAHFQVKPYKTLIAAPVFDVQMSKNRTPLWREAHFQVKMYKTPHCGTDFRCSDVEKSLAAVARSTCVSQNVQNTACSDHFFEAQIQMSKN